MNKVLSEQKVVSVFCFVLRKGMFEADVQAAWDRVKKEEIEEGSPTYRRGDGKMLQTSNSFQHLKLFPVSSRVHPACATHRGF